MSERSTSGPVIGCPPCRSPPAVGVSSPARSLSRVDLPQPLGPMMTTNSPRETARSMPWTATTARSVDSPHTFVTSRHSSAVTAAIASELGGTAPPQHATLDQAERGVAEVADEADHRHAEEGEIHVHHRAAHHHDRAEPGVDADHLGGEDAHPRAEEIHSDQIEEGR